MQSRSHLYSYTRRVTSAISIFSSSIKNMIGLGTVTAALLAFGIYAMREAIRSANYSNLLMLRSLAKDSLTTHCRLKKRTTHINVGAMLMIDAMGDNQSGIPKFEPQRQQIQLPCRVVCAFVILKTICRHSDDPVSLAARKAQRKFTNLYNFKVCHLSHRTEGMLDDQLERNILFGGSLPLNPILALLLVC